MKVDICILTRAIIRVKKDFPLVTIENIKLLNGNFHIHLATEWINKSTKV
jgi:hypothetical protein